MENLFGQIARQKNYVSKEDVKRALRVQNEIKARGEPHKLIGIIMLELGMLSSTQLLDVLKHIEQRRKYF